jgi:hypothetical protein
LPVRRQLKDVEVKRSGGTGVARVRIDLPDTVVHGTVTDGEGRPVADASVSCRALWPNELPVGQLSDSEGRFQFQGLAEGQIVLEAMKGDMTSEPLEVYVVERARPEPVQLVLGRVSRLLGRVVGPWGPILAATVEGLPIGHASNATRGITGVDGQFSMAFASWIRDITLIVMSPGFALHNERVTLSGSQRNEIVVQVDPSPGTLVLKLKAGVLDPSKDTYFLFHNASVIGPAVLGEWVRMNAAVQPLVGAYRIPALESGYYSACTASAQYIPALLAGVLPARAQCSGPGYLPPNGEITLELPPPL